VDTMVLLGTSKTITERSPIPGQGKGWSLKSNFLWRNDAGIIRVKFGERRSRQVRKPESS
jgi:hypothetical protein